MLGDLIATLLSIGRKPAFVEQTDPEQKLAAYYRRTADIRACDPMGHEFRVMAGKAVQRRVAQGPNRASTVLKFRRMK